MTNQRTPALATRDEMLENAVEDICRFAAKLKHSKQNDEQIQKRLTDAGLSSEATETVMKIGLAPIGKDRRGGPKNLLVGALWLGGGLVALGMLRAASSVGLYWLAYGAILLGLLQTLFGLIQSLQAPQGKTEIRNIVERVTSTIKAEEASRWKIAAIKIHNP